MLSEKMNEVISELEPKLKIYDADSVYEKLLAVRDELVNEELDSVVPDFVQGGIYESTGKRFRAVHQIKGGWEGIAVFDVDELRLPIYTVVKSKDASKWRYVGRAVNSVSSIWECC